MGCTRNLLLRPHRGIESGQPRAFARREAEPHLRQLHHALPISAQLPGLWVGGPSRTGRDEQKIGFAHVPNLSQLWGTAGWLTDRFGIDWKVDIEKGDAADTRDATDS